MYNKNNRSSYGRSTSRDGQSNFRSGGARRPHGSGGQFQRRRPELTREQKNFHPSLFIKKAEGMRENEEFIPQHTFNDFEIHANIKKNISERGYINPTPIQDAIIPHVLKGKDVIGLANTGTGKTGAFLIPLINKVYNNPSLKVLIIAPTRELAVQIEDEFHVFARGLQLSSVCVIGGANIKAQSDRIRRVHHFVIGTPGRLIDLEKRGVLKLHMYSSIVLDEVDRMLDMGFIPDMKYIIAKLPEKKHALFFSATLPASIHPVMDNFLVDPVKVVIESQQKTSANVDQDVVRFGGKNKIDVLHDLLIQPGFDRVLIFGKTKHGMNKLSENLLDRGFKVAAIHGNKSQAQRQKALDSFKQGKVNVLLATDIASRGLDINNVTHVINYDLPQSYEDYVHRIGRTGRADKTGKALTFME